MCEKENNDANYFWEASEGLTREPRRAEPAEERCSVLSSVCMKRLAGGCQQLLQPQVTIVPVPFISCEFSVDVREPLQVQLGDISVHQTDFVNKNRPHPPT